MNNNSLFLKKCHTNIIKGIKFGGSTMKTNEELILKLEQKAIKKFSKDYVNLTSKILNKIEKTPNKSTFVFEYYDKSKVFDSGIFKKILEKYFDSKNMIFSSEFGKGKTIYISISKRVS